MQQKASRSGDEDIRRLRARLIKVARARSELSQREAAALIGISRDTLASIESLRRGMTEEVLRATAAALDIPEAKLRNPRAELRAAA